MELYKYPRTPHLVWSPGATSDDKILKDVDHLVDKDVIITEKLDGENFNVYSNGYMHARSLESANHPSQSYVKNTLSQISYQIPYGYRICGENLYATHSIHYDNLASYFQVFSIWNERNICLNWQDTCNLCKILKLETVPVLYRGTFGKAYCDTVWDKIKNHAEGYVVRLFDSFSYDDFATSVAKFVRAHHVQTDEHWKTQKIVPNGLRT
jgi:hypothetical protein